MSWTPTGIRCSLGDLTLDADALHVDRRGLKVLVSVRCRDGLCYRQRINLDDAGQRESFVRRLRLACGRGGLAVASHTSCGATRVRERVLIELGEACRQRPNTQPTDPTLSQQRKAAAAAERRARALLRDPNILHRVAEAMEANGYVGHVLPALLVYVALTSRLMERPINLALVGDPAAGKNATIDAALDLMPSEAYYLFSASSPTSIIYTSEDFKQRVVVFKEADSIPDDGPAASAVRALADDNELRYEVTSVNPTTGRFETRTIKKEGPTGLITTSMRALPPQLNSRVLQVPVADDPETTRKVMQSKGRRAAGKALPTPDFTPFRALQEWLAIAGRRRVIVPFGEELADLMPITSELRVRRDFDKLLSCVKAIAFLHQRRRKRTRGGEILATIEDYATARSLLLASFEAAGAEGASAVMRETVDAIRPGEYDVSLTELAARLRISKPLASWRVERARRRGWLVNDEIRGGRRARLRHGLPLPGSVTSLPLEGRLEYELAGVPSPTLNLYFCLFAEAVAASWPQGFTVADLAGWRKRDPKVVRSRLEVLRRRKLVVYDRRTGRYSILFWVPFDA